MRESPARSAGKSGRSRPAESQLAPEPAAAFPAAWRSFASAVRCGVALGFFLVLRLPCRARPLARQRDDVPAQCRFIVQIAQRREDVRADQLLRMLDRDRRFEQRREILTHIDFLVFAADENGDRRLARGARGLPAWPPV